MGPVVDIGATYSDRVHPQKNLMKESLNAKQHQCSKRFKVHQYNTVSRVLIQDTNLVRSWLNNILLFQTDVIRLVQNSRQIVLPIF